MLASAGCPAGPSRVEAPAFDPQKAASKALELFDTDGSGTIAGKELDQSPGLKSALAAMDQDSDGGLSPEEISDRIAQIVESKLGAMQVACVVLHRGQPLPGVQIRFVPEPFLDGVIQPAEGTTTDGGMGIATLQSAGGQTSGIQPGFYRVELSRQVNGREMLPAKYNTQTVLGGEVSFDNPALREGILRFEIN
jgi:hypothetical protein